MIDIPLRRITAKEAVKLGLIDAIKNDETTLTGVYLIDKNLKMDFAQRNFFFTTKENEIVLAKFADNEELIKFWEILGEYDSE